VEIDFGHQVEDICDCYGNILDRNLNCYHTSHIYLLLDAQNQFPRIHSHRLPRIHHIVHIHL
jgi:hypothetical protein